MSETMADASDQGSRKCLFSDTLEKEDTGIMHQNQGHDAAKVKCILDARISQPQA